MARKTYTAKGKVSIDRVIQLMDKLKATDQLDDVDYTYLKLTIEDGEYTVDTYWNQYKFKTLNEVIGYLETTLAGIAETVKVGEYNAIVTAKGIKVGCQNVSFAEFDALAVLVKKNRPKK